MSAIIRLSDLFNHAFIEEKRNLWNAFILRIGEDIDAMPEFNLILERIAEFVQPRLGAVGEGDQLQET
jgi:hypothetical protein